jgi:hypothetical protein
MLYGLLLDADASVDPAAGDARSIGADSTGAL